MQQLHWPARDIDRGRHVRRVIIIHILGIDAFGFDEKRRVERNGVRRIDMPSLFKD